MEGMTAERFAELGDMRGFSYADMVEIMSELRRLRAEVLTLRKERDAALETIREWREALEWYASKEAHANRYGGWSVNDFTPVNIDRGERARAALDKLKEQQG